MEQTQKTENTDLQKKSDANFRGMRRFKQQLDAKDCVQILKQEKRGVLSVLGDGGYPYGMPMNHWYDEENGKIYFHCAKAGHRFDSIHVCDKVSYCVYDSGFKKEGEWSLNVKSVIVFGRIKTVDDHDTVLKVLRGLGKKFVDDGEYIEDEIRRFISAVCITEITVEHMTGKLVNES